ncbi:hypothetical protein C0J52_05410 [Blattella germanica]|nr:hypothetical protein C0J52_05410 [Blattella germanica]
MVAVLNLHISEIIYHIIFPSVLGSSGGSSTYWLPFIYSLNQAFIRHSFFDDKIFFNKCGEHFKKIKNSLQVSIKLYFVAIIDFRVSSFLAQNRTFKLNIPQMRTFRCPVGFSKVRRTHIPKGRDLLMTMLAIKSLLDLFKGILDVEPQRSTSYASVAVSSGSLRTTASLSHVLTTKLRAY